MDWREGFVVEADGEHAVARVLPRETCPWCGGVGRREVVMRGVSRVGKCRCQRLPDRVALWNAAMVPARHARCTMESFRVDLPGTEVGWRVTRGWLDQFRPGEENPGLLLEGEPGRGKTHLMVAALRELTFRHGVAVRFVEFTHLVARIKEGIGRHDNDATALTPLVGPEVLGIDELGKGLNTNWERGIIDELVTRRYNARRVLLATTNFPTRAQPRKRAQESLATPGLESLVERVGERVFSRLKETVRFAPTLGEDFRTTQGR